MKSKLDIFFLFVNSENLNCNTTIRKNRNHKNNGVEKRLSKDEKTFNWKKSDIKWKWKWK